MLLELLSWDRLDTNLEEDRETVRAHGDSFDWKDIIKTHYCCFFLIKRTETCVNLRGLSLLLELLKLLRCDKADWLVPSDQLSSSRHRGQDDVPAQAANAAQKKKRWKKDRIM